MLLDCVQHLVAVTMKANDMSMSLSAFFLYNINLTNGFYAQHITPADVGLTVDAVLHVISFMQYLMLPTVVDAERSFAYHTEK